MPAKELCFLQSLCSRCARQNIASLDFTPPACLQKLNETQTSLRWVPVKMHLLLSAAKAQRDVSASTPVYDHTGEEQPLLTRWGLLWVGSCPALSAQRGSQPPQRPAAAGLPDPRPHSSAAELCTPAASAESLALPAELLSHLCPASQPASQTAINHCLVPRDVIIPIKLKPIPLQHPLYTGSFTKHIRPLLYPKWTS